ncbi:MAG: hypothetical protein Q8M76_03765, partial [Spirochaetaceae bacterium]|nr:hypothetical protein [Spirochaetaceae bacterium]
MSGRFSRERFVAPAYLIVAALGTIVLAVVFSLSLSSALEIEALADASYVGFKENVIEQSASLSRVIFAAYRVLGFRSESGEPPVAALERRLALCAGLLNHASYVSKGGFESARDLLTDDPLMLADRVEAS